MSFETHAIPASTIEALTIAHEKALKSLLPQDAPKAIINLAIQDRGLIDGYITMNGAYCFVGDEVIYKSAIPAGEVRALAQVCEQKGYPCIFVGEHTISVCQPNKLVHDIFYDFCM